MEKDKATVLIAGATGYLGRHLISAFHEAGYRVWAIARDPKTLMDVERALDRVIQAHATIPKTLDGIMEGVDLVVSALGITRQRDGLTYEDVDFGANRNLLDEALKSSVRRFAYVHVLNADRLLHVEMVAAKSRFAAELSASAIPSTIIAPSGFFSDLVEILKLARSGRVYLFGDGSTLLSPIDGRDLAKVCVAACEAGVDQIDVGGPQTFSIEDVAHLAFDALNKPPTISHLPTGPFRVVIDLAKWLGFGQRIGPLDFFLSVSEEDMATENFGSRSLKEFFEQEAMQYLI